jgi:hypothetical protein
LELVLASAGQALGAKGELAEHIAEQRLLLLFDNFEHVVGAAEELTALLGFMPERAVAGDESRASAPSR